MTLWRSSGESEPSSNALAFTESLEVDYRLYPYDIQASKVWAEALATAGAIPHSDYEEIADTLDEIKQELDEGKFELDPELEDIHMNIESELIDRLGDTGARIHFGRSRNDQILVDVKLYLKDVIEHLQADLGSLLQSLVTRAQEHKETFVPGFTHLQPAQPIRLAHYLMAYFQKFRRDYERLSEAAERLDVMPLGSAALAGSGVDVDREFLARELDFDRYSENSLDAVSERDFMVDILSVLGQASLHASRLCEDWVIWSSPRFGFCEMGEEHTTGSSIMPQKQNPDVAELIRGHSGRMLGHLQGLMTVIKAQPMAYNRDLQEDKVHLFSAIDSAEQWIPLLGDMVDEVSFHEEAMEESLREGYLEATDLADYLVEKGVPFREAHNAVRDVVQKAVDQDVTLRDLPLEDYLGVHDKFDPTIFQMMDADESTQRRDLPGGTGPSAVTQQIDAAEAWLQDHTSSSA
jgi:argininosuccinate lyase